MTLQEAAYTLVSGGDVLQRSGGRLAGGGVDLALPQHAVVHAHDLGVPEPLHTLGHPRHLGEGGDVLAVALSGRHNAALLGWTGRPARATTTPMSESNVRFWFSCFEE